MKSTTLKNNSPFWISQFKNKKIPVNVKEQSIPLFFLASPVLPVVSPDLNFPFASNALKPFNSSLASASSSDGTGSGASLPRRPSQRPCRREGLSVAPVRGAGAHLRRVRRVPRLPQAAQHRQGRPLRRMGAILRAPRDPPPRRARRRLPLRLRRRHVRRGPPRRPRRPPRPPSRRHGRLRGHVGRARRGVLL